MKIISLCIAGIILLPAILFGQTGLHTRYLPDHIGSQFYQPANILLHEYETLSLGTDLGFWINNSSITLDGLFQDGNFIGEESKLQIIDQLGDGNQFQQGADLGYGIINLKTKKLPLSFSFRDRSGIHIQFQNPLTFGLVFRGNAPYAGQTITDEKATFRQYRAYEAGIGTGLEVGKFKLGVRAKLMLGRTLNAIHDLSYTFFTEGDGSRIDLQSTYDMYFPLSQEGIEGIGGGIDLGAIYAHSEKLQFQASLTDLGVISWDTKRFSNSVDISYSGFNLRELIGEDANNSNIFVADTFRTLFFPDSSEERFLMPLPANLALGVTYTLNDKARIMGTFMTGLTGFSPTTQLPLLNIAYHRDLNKWLTVGANAYGGGMDMYGIGIMAKSNFKFKDRYGLVVYTQFDNLLGLAIPSIGRGFSGNVGLGFSL